MNPTDAEKLEFITAVLSIVDAFDCDEILWKVEQGNVGFFVNCSDLFFWALADCEEVRPEDLELFRQAYEDVGNIEKDAYAEAQALYCARKRGMRPQGAAYPKNPDLWPLFDACGPVREVGIGNPRHRPEQAND